MFFALEDGRHAFLRRGNRKWDSRNLGICSRKQLECSMVAVTVWIEEAPEIRRIRTRCLGK